MNDERERSERRVAPAGRAKGSGGRVNGTKAPTVVLGVLALCAQVVGCGGSPTAPQRDEVFYLHGGGLIDTHASWETYFSPLDAPATERLPRTVGVGIFRGDVRMGRPIDWSVRKADYTPGHRFISYQSPRQFLFSIYERIDGPEDTWPDVLKRYESDVDEQGSDVLAARMPVATANTQGRSYFVRTHVTAKPDLQAFAHEILIRSDRRVMLVQIVHGDNIEASADEMVAALQSLTVY
jgi:hypothetical protein